MNVDTEQARLMGQTQAALGSATGKPFVPAGVAPAQPAKSPTATPQRSEAIEKLAAALAKAQALITFASKDSLNPHFKNKYADLAAVWDGCRGPLSTNGLSVVQLPAADGLRVTVTTILLHESGQWISQDLTMYAAQNTPQAVGSTITYARRYALSAIAGIAQQDDDGTAASQK